MVFGMYYLLVWGCVIIKVNYFKIVCFIRKDNLFLLEGCFY